MILEKLVLHNFRAFGGRHELEFAGPSAAKPITLIGAMNGAGKTTLLDAIQLVLYGKLAAIVSSQDSGGYDQFLKRCIHHGVALTDGAALELSFRHRRAGRDHSYVVRRSWRFRSRGALETMRVEVDGEFSHELTDEWASHAETILPSGLAPLFLFDGEKIEQLADPERSAGMLRTAIYGLLGLDIVNQLKNDLVVVERNQAKDATDKTLLESVEEQRQLLESAEQKRTESAEAKAEAATRVGGLRSTVQKLEQRYERDGGSLFDSHSSLRAEEEATRAERSAVERHLTDLVAGPLPLAIVGELCRRTLGQAESDQESRSAELIGGLLEERDRALLESIAATESSKALRDRVDSFLRADREWRQSAVGVERVLDMSDDSRHRLSALLDQELARELKRSKSAVAQLRKLSEKGEGIQVKLAQVPDEEAIKELTVELQEARVSLLSWERELEKRSREHEHAQRSAAHLALRLEAAEKRASRESARRSRADRVSTYCMKSRQTLEAFRQRLLENNCERIAELVLESFQSLHRKRRFIRGIQIDPATFKVELVGLAGEVIDAAELSAGERQLLATALLWGLARASGRELPTVIDTPLGRLDSEHRTHLIERYFPKSARQVVLLSTDEEITGPHLQRLAKSIGKRYRLDFDDTTRSSGISPGYFEE